MRVALLTTGRHDLSYLTPLTVWLRDYCWIRIETHPCVSDGFAARTAAGTMKSAILQLEELNPDCLLVIGDRTETLAACVAATCLKIPIAHVHGGEVTLGAIDNVCRHAISQLARWHFCAHQQAASLLRYMNVPGDIHVTGSPAIDLILAKPRERKPGPDIVFAYHPETLSAMPVQQQIEYAVDIALQHLPEGGKIICVGANPDAGGKQINDYLISLGNPFVMRTGMGSDEYWDLLSSCHALVGNSSSGVIECPALGVPFIEIGDRQKGRARCSYGDGNASERIARVLNQPLGASLSAAPSPLAAP